MVILIGSHYTDWLLLVVSRPCASSGSGQYCVSCCQPLNLAGEPLHQKSARLHILVVAKIAGFAALCVRALCSRGSCWFLHGSLLGSDSILRSHKSHLSPV